MTREQVAQWFKEAVTLNTEAPSDLKETLLRGHPKLEGFIDSLTKQLRDADVINRSRGKVIKLSTMQTFVYDLTKMFMKGMEGEAKKRYESDMQRIMREKEEQKIKDFEETLAGRPVDEFAEAGVITNEKIDKEGEAFRESQEALK